MSMDVGDILMIRRKRIKTIAYVLVIDGTLNKVFSNKDDGESYLSNIKRFAKPDTKIMMVPVEMILDDSIHSHDNRIRANQQNE